MRTGQTISHVAELVLLERIGVGGMGEVYRGELRGAGEFRREVAVKMTSSEGAGHLVNTARLLDEARVLSQLSHPNVAQVLTFGAHQGAYFLVIEYIRGGSLRALLTSLRQRNQRLTQSEGLHIADGLLAALAAAHGQRDPSGAPLSIVHRDVSPENILVSYDGDVKLTDFGIATFRHKEARTGENRLLGKRSYFAPEQLLGNPATPQSDQYAAALVIAEVLSGSPMRGDDMATLRALGDLARGDAVDQAALGRMAMDESMRTILAPALAWEPHARYPNCEALRQAIAGLRVGDESGQCRAQLAARVRVSLPHEGDTGEPRADAPPGSEDAKVTFSVPLVLPSDPAGSGTSPRQPGRRAKVARRPLLLGTLAVALVLVVVAVVGVVVWRTHSPIGRVAHLDDARPRDPAAVQPDSPSGKSDIVDISNSQTLRGPPLTPTPIIPKTASAPRGFLEVSCLPWCQISVDGASIANSSPLIGYSLATGRHVVEVINPPSGWGAKRIVNIAARDTVRLRFVLRP